MRRVMELRRSAFVPTSSRHACVLVLVVGLGGPFGSASAQSPTPTPTQAPAVARAPGVRKMISGPAVRIDGVYLVTGTATQIGVKRLFGDFYQLASDDGWDGVGILDSTLFRGVIKCRATSDPATSDATGRILIDFSHSTDPRMHLVWTSVRSGELDQVWRARGVGSPAGGPIDTPAPDHLPTLNEYVHADELPEAITRVPPQYPQWAREKAVDGTVMVQALVLKDGTVGDVRVLKSIPPLDTAAVACVRQWRFKPAKDAGKPVAVWVAVPVKFSLH